MLMLVLGGWPAWWNHERVLSLMIVPVCISLTVTATAMLVVRLRLREQSLRRAKAEAEFFAGHQRNLYHQRKLALISGSKPDFVFTGKPE